MSEEFSYKKIAPESIDDFARIFGEAREAGLKLSIRGLCTQGTVPDGVLEVSTLNLRDFDPGYEGNMVVSVGAGLKYSELKSFIGKAAESWSDYGGTVGGLFCGSRKYQAFQQLYSRVLSIKIIRTNGDIITLGSKAVKDVAGFRIIPLFAGSRGRLGLVAELAINTAPMYREFHDFTPISHQSKKSAGNKIIAGLYKLFDPQGILV